MKRLVFKFGLAVAAVVLLSMALWIPRFRNMGAEYATAEAIRDLERYVRENDGKWPQSAADLGDKYPAGGAVDVDYSVTADRLLEDPELLRDSVRPASGKFYTFPHYEEKIRGLHAVLREQNQRARD